ncbi:alpha-L-fucosidase [Chryseolinea lacunae]|uniref:alpha-L-fucosidase n=1 Tax=Chryseolinea lacunae TaxID=2801331 RepID=A0ABS1L143_9BACT|nr:alpha-L-fucosidase [Chryseolinea lacunae]MBL0745424.1 alpha-L-fucosidase [Chryseolinea lacunae]
MRKMLPLLLLLTGLVSVNAQTVYQPTWESLKQYQCPEWFRDAKFGIFIHWGVYSVPAVYNEWYARNMYVKDTDEFKYHIGKYGSQAKFGYKDFIPMFKAEKFNADEWVSIFKRSGAKYIVPVAEHHDGFAMYNTALSHWNAVEMGPKRDIIGELSVAARKQNLIFGLSSHRIEHWWFMNGGTRYDSDVRDPAFKDFYGPAREESDTPSPEYMNDWLLRNVELVDKYNPQLFWFDWWIEQPAMDPYRKSFAAYYYNKGNAWNKGVVINYKNNAYPEGTAVYDIERGSSKATRKFPWQTDTSIGKKSWGYIEGEENKDANELIDALIDIVSKNGNLLLNIGPRADGTITEGQQKVLLDMGQWLEVNGEAIFETRPWKLSGEGPTENPDEHVQFNEYAFKGYTPSDIRFTEKNGTLYLLVMGVPQKNIVAKALGQAAKNGIVKTIELLGSKETVTWKQADAALTIVPAKTYGTTHAVVYRIQFR